METAAAPSSTTPPTGVPIAAGASFTAGTVTMAVASSALHANGPPFHDASPKPPAVPVVRSHARNVMLVVPMLLFQSDVPKKRRRVSVSPPSSNAALLLTLVMLVQVVPPSSVYCQRPLPER